MKTGALFAFSAQAGAVLHRQPPHVCQALEAYGYAMGIAFQMWDDVLDEPTFESKEDHAQERGVLSSTLRGLIGRDSIQKLLDDSIANALEHLRSFGDRAHLLRDAVSFAVQRQK
jgi:farnesyl diphosphate synthase